MYADLLGKKVARLFPTDALAHGLSRLDMNHVQESQAGLARLKERNPTKNLVSLPDLAGLKCLMRACHEL